MPRFAAATQQPRHTFFMQQYWRTECSLMGSGIGKVQIGQKSPSRGSCSSFNSEARLSHSPLCCFQWALLQSTLQYLTRRQAVQFLSLTASLDSLAQFAQTSPLMLRKRCGVPSEKRQQVLCPDGLPLANRWSSPGPCCLPSDQCPVSLDRSSVFQFGCGIMYLFKIWHCFAAILPQPQSKT